MSKMFQKKGGAEFIVRASLHDESNNGWVWLGGNHAPVHRSTMTFRNPVTRRYVYVEVRRIDDNFCKEYNSRRTIKIYESDSNNKTRTDEIHATDNVVVMAEWYRNALGIDETTDHDNLLRTVYLVPKKTRIDCWASIRAACHNPDLVARIGTRLGVLGALLGVLGVWLGVLGTWPDVRCQAFIV